MHHGDIRKVQSLLAERSTFVVKPASGARRRRE
jgi:hypothetical protein